MIHHDFSSLAEQRCCCSESQLPVSVSVCELPGDVTPESLPHTSCGDGGLSGPEEQPENRLCSGFRGQGSGVRRGRGGCPNRK